MGLKFVDTKLWAVKGRDKKVTISANLTRACASRKETKPSKNCIEIWNRLSQSVNTDCSAGINFICFNTIFATYDIFS